jgi:hypothetical protein
MPALISSISTTGNAVQATPRRAANNSGPKHGSTCLAETQSLKLPMRDARLLRQTAYLGKASILCRHASIPIPMIWAQSDR